jgi:hypothetical protein
MVDEHMYSAIELRDAKDLVLWLTLIALRVIGPPGSCVSQAVGPSLSNLTMR